MHSFTLPEVCNYLPPNILSRVFVAKEKRTAVYFDRGTSQFVGVDAACMEQLRHIFPGVNIVSELKKMSLWLVSSKGLKSKGTINFITNWLAKAPVTQPPPAEVELDNPLRPHIDTYLKDLWKGKEHLLEMNKKRS